MRLPLLALALGLLLVGCKFDLKPVLYLGDVLEPVSATELPTVEATLEFDSSSVTDKMDFLLGLIGKYLTVTGETTVGGTEYAKTTVVPISLPLVEGVPPPDAVFYLSRQSVDGGVALDFHVNEERFAQADAELREAVYSGLDLKEIGLTVTVINDLREPQTLTAASVYVDGKPIPFSASQTLARRQNVELKPSNVLQDSWDGDHPMRLLVVAR